MTRLVTFETVAAAAQGLLDARQRPSVRTVIAALGGGSPNTVLPLLNEWKASRPIVQNADIAIDPGIGQLIAQQIGAAVADAVRSAEQKSFEVQREREAAESVRQELVRVPRLESKVDALAARLQKSEADLAAARQAEAVACARAESAIERAVELAARLSKAEEQTEKVRADLAGAQDRERAALLAAQKASDELAALLKVSKKSNESDPY